MGARSGVLLDPAVPEATFAEERERVASMRRWLASGSLPYDADPERIRRGVFYNHAGLLRNALAIAHGQTNVFKAMEELPEEPPTGAFS